MAKRVLNSELMEKLNNIENKLNQIQQMSNYDWWFTLGVTSMIGGMSFSYATDEKLVTLVFMVVGVLLMIVSNIKTEMLSNRIKNGK